MRHFYGRLGSPRTRPHAGFHQMVDSKFKNRTDVEGVYSGNFYIDPQGTWNGTSFTITVNDTVPHFFHAITGTFVSNCALMANLSVSAQFPDNVDELFALNPVFAFSNSANSVER